jgi:hypothetical protein
VQSRHPIELDPCPAIGKDLVQSLNELSVMHALLLARCERSRAMRRISHDVPSQSSRLPRRMGLLTSW